MNLHEELKNCLLRCQISRPSGLTRAVLMGPCGDEAAQTKQANKKNCGKQGSAVTRPLSASLCCLGSTKAPWLLPPWEWDLLYRAVVLEIQEGAFSARLSARGVGCP